MLLLAYSVLRNLMAAVVLLDSLHLFDMVYLFVVERTTFPREQILIEGHIVEW